MRIKLSLFILLAIMVSSCGPYLTCEKVKTGAFYMIYSDKDSVLMERKGNVQVEYSGLRDKENGAYSNLEWIDECTYRLKFDESKHELNKSQKLVNDNNGIVVTQTPLNDRCMYYTAVLTLANGKSVKKIGRICLK
ncbi:hypothetical protein LV716_13815 [Flagellimonas sp. HMM57]|uniref:hypothetical protein n=1 Tax=unclassified Flagellimonas TaxID=2644544 RepID=UPI0013D1ED10|nr:MULTISPECIES: hypothetical protein [unclassified Flagellimonas]UII75324.1 hypothetical protein LV716_13815 [Flagellimonas sp. HMM57]